MEKYHSYCESVSTEDKRYIVQKKKNKKKNNQEINQIQQ